MSRNVKQLKVEHWNNNEELNISILAKQDYETTKPYFQNICAVCMRNIYVQFSPVDEQSP